jgi:hypothetical protein
LAKGVDESQYDQWDHQRADYNDQYRNTDTYAQSGFAPPYFSPAYGWNDLNCYGSFIDMPGYGYMWRPYGVSYMWNPFSDGAWVWYPRDGYTWVSYYPWGWAPYRYGSWNYVPSYGWYWRPGGPWNTWYTAPPVYNPPTYWTRPVPPATPNRPTVFVGRPVPPGAVGTGPIVRDTPPHRGVPLNRPGDAAGVSNPRNTIPVARPGSGTQGAPVRSKTIDNDNINRNPASGGGIRVTPGDSSTRPGPARDNNSGRSEGIRPAPPTTVTPPLAPTPRVSQPAPVTPRTDTPRGGRDMDRGGDRSAPRPAPAAPAPRSAPSAPAPRPSMDRGPSMVPPPAAPSRPSTSSSSRGPGRH